MPIKFISLDQQFVDYMNSKGYESFRMHIEEYKPDKRTYYVSPANSMCFMDGGIDMALSRKVFPGIEPKLKGIVSNMGIMTKLGRPYLPIGSSVIIDWDDNKSMIAAPTMLLPQSVIDTRNAYWASISVLYNILCNRGESIDAVDILMTSMCCGYGKMTFKQSADQILDAIRDYEGYDAECINRDIILAEPNLDGQPRCYGNTEWGVPFP